MKNTKTDFPFSFWWIIPLTFVPLLYLTTSALMGTEYLVTIQVVCLLVPSLIALLPAKQLQTLWHYPNLKIIAYSSLFFIGLSIVLNWEVLPFWDEIFPMPEIYQQALEKLLHKGQPWGLLTDLFIAALVPAFCEEFFFRGVYQNLLMKRFSPRWAILITAFFFSAYHLNPWYFPFYLVLGCIFGWLAWKYKSLPLAVFAHFLNNATSLVLYHHFDIP